MSYVDTLTELLPLVEKPARYIGGEWNAVRKSDRGPDGRPLTRVALCFPDTYELGMSHLGMKILYAILNAHPELQCERVFAPWTDMEARMRARGVPLLSLETQRPVHEADIVGFSLQYELSYTNVLAMLDLAGIPLRSVDRRRDHPLVIAGGPCAFNPEPLAPFIDVFLLGDAEQSLPEFALDVRRWRAEGLSREEMLREADRAREAYVPLLHRDVKDARTGLRHVPRVYVMKKTLKDVDRAPYPTDLVVPFTEAVHDRVTFEVSRGCQVGCRFCQAGIIYRPARDREVATVLPIVEKSLRSTGYDEVALLSLNAGGYPHIHEVARSLVSRFRGDRIAVSLSSLRAPLLTAPLAEAVGQVRKTGFTIAPECGTERLRRIINKNVTHEDVIRAARNAFGAGWSLIKLYFMIGLPTETNEDIDAIVELGREVVGIGRELHAKGARVNLGVSCFVPKPHTPFQWLPMERTESLLSRQRRLAELVRGTSLRIKGHDARQSLVECVLSRGDRSVADALELAFRRGHRFDGWDERFDLESWMLCFKDAGVDPDIYLYKTWSRDDHLPWDHIRTGVFKGFLHDELEKALRVEVTPECGPDLCFSCGPCSKDFLRDLKEKRSKAYPEASPRGEPQRVPASFGYRVSYRKSGLLRFLSHLDLVRTWNRAVHRAALPMAYSQGFHPLPRISMGPALPVGVGGEREIVDLELQSYLEPEVVAVRLRAAMPADLHVSEVSALSRDSPNLSVSPLTARYVADVSAFGRAVDEVAARVARFLSREAAPVVRVKKGRHETRDVRGFVRRLQLGQAPQLLDMEIRVSPEGSVSPFLVLAAVFDLSAREAARAHVLRVALEPETGEPLTPRPRRMREPIYA